MKYRLLTCVFIFFACLTVVGQVNQVWWSKGRVLHVNPVAEIDSVTYGQFVNADTFLIVIDRASRRIVYDTIDEHVPGMVFHDTIHTTHTVYLNPGRRIGVFSVAKDRQVSFSQGNLQYIQSRDKWQFANTQYEYMGNRHFVNGQLADTIEYFGWSGKNSKVPWGISLSINLSDYKGEFLDWGTNVISGDVANTWRILSNDELIYLCQKRENASQLLGLGYIGAISGLIILPDDWVAPEGLLFTPNTNDASLNQYTKEQWAIMENAGAVFIPASGYFNHKLNNMRGVNESGYYRVSTLAKDGRQIYLIYKKDRIIYSYSGNNDGNLFYAFPVRLVHDTIVPPPAPCETFEVNGVKFNMMCVEGGTFMMGSDDSSKEKPMHQVTVSDFMIGETEVTQELWQAVMGSNPSRFNGVDNPVEFVSWSDCQKFIANINLLTGKCFRLPTEAEWEYAACGGNASVGYKFAGSDNIDKVGWYTNNSQATTHPVATKSPNELGIYDMSGNVWEWCQDWYGDYGSDIQINPQGSLSGSARVIRGGSWMNDATTDCRVSRRLDLTPMARTSNLGFRLVLDAHEYVDLGLSVMWATTNVGATAPEEYGDYFAWGEVEPKEKYDWTTYSYCNGTSTTLTKYCNKSGYGDNGFTDDKILLDIEDDVAHTIWGGAWRIPSKEEASELIEKCSWTWTQCNGIYGHKVTGVNGNSIFLPAASYKGSGPSYSIGEYGLYWLNELNTTSNHFADLLFFGADNTLNVGNSGTRCFGFAVRPVYPILPPAPCETFEVNGVTFNMMCVEGGTFMMGKGKDEHHVTLSDYYIGETEVTQGMWRAVMGNVPDGQEYYGDEYPVAQVTLADCRRFVERLNQITGRHFRVPTEAEWEYAARGGRRSKGFIYAGSDSIGEVAWYKDNMTENKPHPVAQLKPNELGTYDMTGNLAEWVSDWCAPYNLYPQINPTGAAVPSVAGSPVSYRGGCWTYSPKQSESTYRHSFPNRAASGIGFRLAMSDEEPFRAVYVNDTTRFYLRKVDGGTFMMGSRDDDPIIQQNLAAKGDELPQHKVTLDSDYYVAEYEVTQALWTAVMGTDIYDMHAALTKPGPAPVYVGDAYPMSYVYTSDIFEFTRRLSKLTGINFRLPTEAEWEFAARGGNMTHGYLYAGSNNVDSVATYGGKTMLMVGKKMPNELGLYDMSGNVLERCVDYLEYHQPYEPSDSINPRGKVRQSGNRAYRGGSLDMHKDSVRVTHRAPQTPTYTYMNVGTRLVVNEEHHFQTFKVGNVWFDMIYVKGGTFQMGCTQEIDSEAYAHEAPVHEVTLSDYYIGQLEVTQALWKAVMGSSNNPSTIKDNNLPVNNVSWDDCQLFIQKLNEMTGYKFRLPTEAEWEYAARGGHKSKGYKYSGSNNADEVAWYSANSGAKTHAFATKQPNELGIYDMSGNVWEWCYDWYGPYTAEAQVNPQGPESGEYRMYRGGGFGYNAADCRVTRRRRTASYAKEALGLRLVLEVEIKVGT